ncbi:MAG TPA: type IV pilin N-terminal domain-containing protein [Thermoplasmata archaeon]|nr:type IV pilin N-terminal domain-containing protein [Thermoplasmata archaeon]
MTGIRRWRGRRTSFSSGRRRGKRGVSDVIATILLLALTVTLFSAIFAFVTTFPSPPASNNNQFQASLSYPTNGSLAWIAGVSIVHLTGPQVPGTGSVYLKSSSQPNAPEFQNAYSVSSGLGGASVWNLGQTWQLTFPITQMPMASGNNITIYIVSQGQLLFSVILPGSALNTPPTVVSTSVSPALPAVNQAFTVYATLAGAYKTNSVYVNLVSMGLGTHPMTQNGQGQWYYTASSGVSTNGTFYGFVNASGLAGTGLTAIGAVVVTISTGGGSGGAPITVEVLAIPQPPTNYVGTSYFAAVITYTGSVANAGLTVSFWVNQTPLGLFHPSSSSQLTAPAGLTISGPTTVTVYATSPSPGAFSNWVLNSTVKLTASASIAGVGSASGTNPIATPNYFSAIVYATGNPSSSCRTSGTSCPAIDVSIWNNWTAALGDTGTLTFAGKVYANHSGTHMGPYSVSLTLAAGPTSNLGYAALASWKPSVAGAYTITFILTVTYSVTGTVVGYIYDTATATSS